MMTTPQGASLPAHARRADPPWRSRATRTATAWRLGSVFFQRLLTASVLMLASWQAWAFDIQDLQTLLRTHAVVRGDFVQQRYFRSLPQPLTSQGQFTLAAERGLLWQLTSPLRQHLRITAQGIDRQDEAGQWAPLAGAAGSTREAGLFLAVLAGDTRGLRDNFELTLSGTANDWTVRMTPRSALLRQVFDHILIAGNAYVQQIDLHEAQGDRTVLRLTAQQAAAALAPEETRAFSP